MNLRNLICVKWIVSTPGYTYALKLSQKTLALPSVQRYFSFSNCTIIIDFLHLYNFMATWNFRFLILCSVPESIYTLNIVYLSELLSNVHALNVKKKKKKVCIPSELVFLFSERQDNWVWKNEELQKDGRWMDGKGFVGSCENSLVFNGNKEW